MSVDYSSTLNLPKTDFPMRANLPVREPEILKKWQEEDLYGKLMEKNADKPSFILHDGPPYANGDIHAGHMLDKILKDIVIRFKNMDICQLIEELRQESGKDIWICGGAKVAEQLITKNMINTYHLAIIPVILGGGVRLFGASTQKIDLVLVETKKYNGIVEVIYNRRQI